MAAARCGQWMDGWIFGAALSGRSFVVAGLDAGTASDRPIRRPEPNSAGPFSGGADSADTDNWFEETRNWAFQKGDGKKKTRRWKEGGTLSFSLCSLNV
jgi:hypothetical protein